MEWLTGVRSNLSVEWLSRKVMIHCDWDVGVPPFELRTVMVWLNTFWMCSCCENVVLTYFDIKTLCNSWNNNWIQLLFREVQNAFITQWLSTVLSQKSIRWPWGPNDPGLGCATSARLSNMRPVAGKSSILCPFASRELWKTGGLTSYPCQDSNPRSELTFERTQCSTIVL